MRTSPISLFFFFFNDTATTEIYTLSLHDALPISGAAATPSRSCDSSLGLRLGDLQREPVHRDDPHLRAGLQRLALSDRAPDRSEEHTSELQSRLHIVCRLLLEKKKKYIIAQQVHA